MANLTATGDRVQKATASKGFADPKPEGFVELRSGKFDSGELEDEFFS